MVAQFVRFCQILHRRSVRLKVVLRQRQHTDNAVHRGTNLMRHARQEGRLGLALLLDLRQAFLVLFNLSAQSGRAVEAQQIVHAVLAAGCIHLHPFAVFHAENGVKRLFSIPHAVFLPDGNAFLFVLERVRQHHNVLLQLLDRHTEQTLHVAYRTDRQQVALAHDKTHVIRLSVHIVQQNLIRSAERTPLFVRALPTVPQRNANQRNGQQHLSAADHQQRKVLAQHFQPIR